MSLVLVALRSIEEEEEYAVMYMAITHQTSKENNESLNWK